jgi:hypothetical protein
MTPPDLVASMELGTALVGSAFALLILCVLILIRWAWDSWKGV